MPTHRPQTAQVLAVPSAARAIPLFGHAKPIDIGFDALVGRTSLEVVLEPDARLREPETRRLRVL
jgi:hypothetical protein